MILQYTALRTQDDLGVDYHWFTQGAGGVNAAGAIALATVIDTSVPVGDPWIVAPFESFTSIAGETLDWAQNIVWGGAAGCMPVLIGWSAVTGGIAWEPVLLFLVVGRIVLLTIAREEIRQIVGLDVGGLRHVRLDIRNLLRSERGGVREVEAQAVGRDQRALLRDMTAQPVSQRRVQQVRRRVIGADRITARDVDRQLHRVAAGKTVRNFLQYPLDQIRRLVPRQAAFLINPFAQMSARDRIPHRRTPVILFPIVGLAQKPATQPARAPSRDRV